jgi:hypothetical protein
VYDSRIVMSMIHRYGQACREGDLAAVGLLYSEIVRALDDNDEAPARSEDQAGALPIIPGSARFRTPPAGGASDA